MIVTALTQVTIGGEKRVVEGPLLVDPRWTVQACPVPEDEGSLANAWSIGYTSLVTLSPNGKVQKSYTVKETPKEIDELLRQNQPILFSEAQSLLTFALASLDAIARKAKEES